MIRNLQLACMAIALYQLLLAALAFAGSMNAMTVEREQWFDRNCESSARKFTWASVAWFVLEVVK